MPLTPGLAGGDRRDHRPLPARRVAWEATLNTATQSANLRRARHGSRIRRLAPFVFGLLLVLSATPSPAAAADPPARDAEAGSPAPSGPETGGLSAAGRWIVVLKAGADVPMAASRATRFGVHADRQFRSALRGYSARLTATQVADLRTDPSVAAIVPDAVLTLQAQTLPTGVSRVFGQSSRIAAIDGVDQRVDADVAVVDTGIDRTHPDLNVAGGVNCSTSNRSAWQDDNGHGTHVAGTIGALDNGSGVVGVAPGVRLWAVRVLNSAGAGLVSWYVCGLDWITAQRDPNDPTRPLFEAVNMSVARPGADDHACGTKNKDLIHQAICRLVASGVTVVAAAGNNSFNAAKLIPASYNEVITVSALADTDGKTGGTGGHRCYSWGSYDSDDTFANFSNYGADVDLIAPGKCIWSTLPGNRYGYLSGTSMAAPHVTGAVALYKASRPLASPSQVQAALVAAGTRDWNTATDPDSTHERLLDVGRIVALGDYTVDVTPNALPLAHRGSTIQVPVDVIRAENVPDDVDLSADVPAGLSASFSSTRLSGLGGTHASMTVRVGSSAASGSYPITIRATSGPQVRTKTVTLTVDATPPVVRPPALGPVAGTTFSTSSFAARGTWHAATDAHGIARYQAAWQVDGHGWSKAVSLGASTLGVRRTFVVGHGYQLRVRAEDKLGNWSAWVTAPAFTASVVQDTSPIFVRTGTWSRYRNTAMSGGTTLDAKAKGASLTGTFTGRGIAIIAPLGTTRGKAQVWIDGTLAWTLDLHRSSPVARRVVAARTWLTSRSRQIRIVVLGTAGHPRVDLDALVIIH